ncbi:TetR/AcrR family transcriptional regulator [Taibaiella lutea]|uniref:TetR/AcrR family transcriptional regulator n=1 Tax=Taibaiella lutea TaxID=2608001 RepID=A0A5M6CN61_9BACT|nr:TetR/AcrR family transcriptional regulator [Taibaiella lutea]KAA5536483.1 TetR/AcrR family transcriptional regulator [Taibaiella lutea]
METELNDKQLQIMQKALEVFAEKGFDSASVRDIAQRADVNVAMISYYFGSKEKLLEAIFLNNTNSMKGKIENIIHSRAHGPMEKVDLLIDTYVNVIIENRTFHSLMMREQVLLKDGPLYTYVRDMKRRNRSLIEVAVKAGQKAGIFQKNIDVSMLAITLFGSVNHFFSNYKFLCEDFKIKPTDGDFDIKAIEKLKGHIKIMFKAFLTYGISNKK